MIVTVEYIDGKRGYYNNVERVDNSDSGNDAVAIIFEKDNPDRLSHVILSLRHVRNIECKKGV
jgi:hypothetical protein